jgi:hypothetical protein
MADISLCEFRRRRDAAAQAGAAEALGRHLRERPVVVRNHLAVGRGGVTVIDARRLSGPIRVADEGFFRPRRELRVDGVVRTSLVAGVVSQVAAVCEALEAGGLHAVDVRGALLFLGGDLPLLGLRDVQGVVLGRPRRIAKLIRRPGGFDVDAIAAALGL